MRPSLLPYQPSSALRVVWADCLFLAIVVVLSFIWYAPRLGFYSDDWAFFGRYATATEQSVAGFYAASMSAQHAMRPVQVWLCAALYALFGLNPLLHHLFNGALLTTNVILIYLIAGRLHAPRALGLAVALVYGLLPNYSTDRVWFLAFAIVLSMTGWLASLYAALRAVDTSARSAILWGTVSVAALIVSTLSYEAPLPLFLLSPIILIWRQWRAQDRVPRHRFAVACTLAAAHVAALAGVIAFKLQTTVRLGASDGVAAQIGDIARQAIRRDLPEGHYGLNIFSALHVHFGDYGIGLPMVAWELSRSVPAMISVLAVILGLATFGYLAAVMRHGSWPSGGHWGTLFLAGIVIFVLGYTIFLTNYNVQFTPTGIANRSAIAATLGAAMAIVGAIGLMLEWVPVHVARVAFAAAVAIAASCSFVVVNAIGQRWAEAYQMERRILSTIRETVPTLPSNSTFLLDGVCPYHGPAVVFESNWDLAGALQVLYRDPTLAADVVTPRLAVTEEGITTTIYGATKIYPYDEQLVVYNMLSGDSTSLRDVGSARRYFAASVARAVCPPGQEGLGVRMF